MEISTLFILLVYSMASGLFTARVASAKGYDPRPWFFGGFFFSILGLLAAVGLPDRAAEANAAVNAAAKAAAEMAPTNPKFEAFLREEKERQRLAKAEAKRKQDPMNFVSNLPPLEDESTGSENKQGSI